MTAAVLVRTRAIMHAAGYKLTPVRIGKVGPRPHL